MIYITLDVDWAPDFVLEEVIDLFSEYKLPSTIFATHDSSILKKLPSDTFEIALHPNYIAMHDDKAGFDYQNETLKLQNIYPEAKGIRSHGIVQSAKLHAFWKEIGLEYESNQYIPFDISFFRDYTGLTRCHVYWGDNIPLITNSMKNNINLKITDKFPRVLVFHPIHIYLNTYSLNHYNEAKILMDKVNLDKHVNRQERGIKDMIISLFTHASNHNYKFGLLKNAPFIQYK
jgi:hypothetical protein